MWLELGAGADAGDGVRPLRRQMNNPHLMRNREIARSTQRAVIGRLPKLRKIIYAPVDGPRNTLAQHAPCSARRQQAPEITRNTSKKKKREKQQQTSNKQRTANCDQRVGC